jgi:DNA adenine methylase
MAKNGKVVTPLRYPGGKSRALEEIAHHAPTEFATYWEPFIGGGSVFLHFRQLYPNRSFWINDLNIELYYFWRELQQNGEHLADEVARIKTTTTNGKGLFYELRDVEVNTLTDVERAVRFFVLNRIGFSGTVESGGYSQGAFDGRFTDSAIERLRETIPLLQGVRITNLDYREMMKEQGQNTFVFLDPPYYSATKSRLYGKKGSLHTTFDHDAFAETMQRCPHQWLITYDDSPHIRSKFGFAHLHEWTLQYGMNNYKQGKAEAGRELFICNYEIKAPKERQLALL